MKRVPVDWVRAEEFLSGGWTLVRLQFDDLMKRPVAGLDESQEVSQWLARRVHGEDVWEQISQYNEELQMFFGFDYGNGDKYYVTYCIRDETIATEFILRFSD